MQKDAILYNSDVYDQLDTLSLVNSLEILKEIFIETTSLLIKKEIINICKNDDIYQMALNTRNPQLKIEVIKAIHKELKSKWALDSEDAEISLINTVIKPKKKSKPKEIVAAPPEEVGRYNEEFGDSIPEIISEPENVVLEDIELISDPVVVEVTAEIEPIFVFESAPISPESPPIKEEAVLNKRVISQIFNLYTLVDLVKSNPEWLEDIHIQIGLVLGNERAIQKLEERN